MRLPFLDDKKWPGSKEPEEIIVNQSPDAQLQEHLVEAILIAMNSHDQEKIRKALHALIENILQEEP